MKIKTKKRMSPEEYTKYMIDKHGISGLEYELINDNIIDAPKRYVLTFELNPVSMKEISDTGFENKEFTIEVEEDIAEKQLDQYKIECERLKQENNNLKQSVNEYKNYAESHVANYLEFRALEKENEKLKQEIRQLKGED